MTAAEPVPRRPGDRGSRERLDTQHPLIVTPPAPSLADLGIDPAPGSALLRLIGEPTLIALVQARVDDLIINTMQTSAGPEHPDRIVLHAMLTDRDVPRYQPPRRTSADELNPGDWVWHTGRRRYGLYAGDVRSDPTRVYVDYGTGEHSTVTRGALERVLPHTPPHTHPEP
jgi:hypothetical protein